MTGNLGIVRRIKGKAWSALDIDRRLRHVGDDAYLRLRYWIELGKRLNLASPTTFNEKLQWLKLHDRNPLYTRLVDKHAVKEWVSDRIGAEHVIPMIGVWNSFDDIPFDSLPSQFVLKCTHDSGGLAICWDRSHFDFDAARTELQRSLNTNYFLSGREWPYRDVVPRILAELYFPSWRPGRSLNYEASVDSKAGDGGIPARPAPGEIIDYKFYCFHGEPKFLYVSQGLHDHKTARMVFLYPDWTRTGFGRTDYQRFDTLPPKPKGFDRMMSIARQLSSNIPFVRVDLFEHHEQVLFSEMTFHPASGMMLFDPPSADLEVGHLLDISCINY